MNKLRNIGVVAHINAGKTTTTERILYHAGTTNIVGDVDLGNTVTDYLVQERDRGITITSAAVSFDWKKHRINLIDTPGHLDFTIEVERSLSILDGAVTILDSSAGVEAQTMTVWNQAKKYKLPNIIYLNKYDKPKANYKNCINDLRDCLGIRSCLIQLPIKNDPSDQSIRTSSNFSILDIIRRKLLIWHEPEENYGSKFIQHDLSSDMIDGEKKQSLLSLEYVDLMEECREKLINTLSDTDDIFANYVIECDKISEVKSDDIMGALRRSTLSCGVSPVLVGSSFKYIGVQQLMEAIVDYLPDPNEREHHIRQQLSLYESINDEQSKQNKQQKGVCAFIFKINHHPRWGPLSFLKICNGTLKRGQSLKNLGTNQLEQVKRIYRVFADDLTELFEPIEKNDIVAVSGLSESRTADILVDPSLKLSLNNNKNNNNINNHDNNDNNNKNIRAHEIRQLNTNGTQADSLSGNNNDNDQHQHLPFELLDGTILMPKLRNMDPVYYCSIEAANIGQQLKLENALKCLAREDPSFKHEIDQHGITTIRGMGKLHLEIIRDRIESEYKINPILGPLHISYRETIEDSGMEEFQVSKMINGVNNHLSIKLFVKSKPGSGPWSGKMLRLDHQGQAETSEARGVSSLSALRRDHRKAIESGLESAMAHGPMFGYPMIDCDISLMSFQANGRCSLPVISWSSSECLMGALKRSRLLLLEPISLLEVITPIQFNSIIQGDLQSKRRAVILGSSALNDGNFVIKAHVPLSSLANYSEFLRIQSSGRASFSMELVKYSPMSETDRMHHLKVAY